MESMNSDFNALNDFTDLIKTEAIKEFAEKIKAKSHKEYGGDSVYTDIIDNLVKEMVGERTADNV